MWWTIQDVTAGTAVETYNSDLSHAAARLLPDDFQGRSRLVGGCLVNQILWVPTINNNLAFRSAAGGCFPGDFTARASLIFDFREKWAVFRTQSTLAPALTTIQFEAGPKPTGNWRETLSTLCKNRIPVNAQPRSCSGHLQGPSHPGKTSASGRRQLPPCLRGQITESLLDSGKFENRSALAHYLGVSRARVTQVLKRLT